MAQWFYASGGQQVGPVEEAELMRLMASGQVGPSDLVWKDGMPNWVSASTVPELGVPPAAPQIPLAPPAGGPQPYPQQPAVQPIPYGGYVAPRERIAAGAVPTYLTQSILVTIFCCWALGIPAIVFAAQVNGKLARGDYAGAIDASNKAKLFTWLSFGFGLLVFAIWLIAVVAGSAGR
jgi:hypothetical protein